MKSINLNAFFDDQGELREQFDFDSVKQYVESAGDQVLVIESYTPTYDSVVVAENYETMTESEEEVTEAAVSYIESVQNELFCDIITEMTSMYDPRDKSEKPMEDRYFAAAQQMGVARSMASRALTDSGLSPADVMDIVKITKGEMATDGQPRA